MRLQWTRPPSLGGGWQKSIPMMDVPPLPRMERGAARPGGAGGAKSIAFQKPRAN
jgi:hypothetical protein